ncbi:MAG: hypothetical protein WCO48_03440, partial [Candidatus Taylorbacteria bacterium]
MKDKNTQRGKISSEASISSDNLPNLDDLMAIAPKTPSESSGVESLKTEQFKVSNSISTNALAKDTPNNEVFVPIHE